MSTCRAGSRSTPGRKDPRKLRLFVEEARVAGERLSDATAGTEDADLVEPNGAYDDDHGREPAEVERSRPFDWMFDA